MKIDWPDLWNLLEPHKGERFALVRDTVSFTMELIDLERLFVVMSGSKAEQELNTATVEAARGDVLVYGFGLGLILIPMMNKPDVTSVTVVELHQEVLDLVAAQHALNDKVRIVLGDALTYVPDRQYDLIFSDIDTGPDEMNAYPMLGPRMGPFLKPGGQYLQWNNDGRFRA